MPIIRLLAVCCLLLLLATVCRAATVDTIRIASPEMGKDYKAVVVLPDGYAEDGPDHPVLYLLHGGLGHFDDWILKVPDTSMIPRLADTYGFIIVMPEGEWFSYYLDSPVREDSQFETYLTETVIGTIDARYRTVAGREGRVVTGLSMGGYGSLYLSARHPDLFCAAGSMSGALNPDMMGWKLPPQATEDVARSFAGILGPKEGNAAVYADANVLAYAEAMRTNDVALTIACGIDDFLIEPNRELHRRLVFNGTPHDYLERPGGHSWEFWGSTLPYQVLFFSKVLEERGTLVSGQ